MIKVTYSEIIKDRDGVRGALIERTRNVSTLTEAVNFSRYIANTVNLVGKPIVEEIK